MPVRAIPKLLSEPETMFQLTSLVQPTCGVKRTSNPPPTWPTAFISLSWKSLRTTPNGCVGSRTKSWLKPPPNTPPPPSQKYGATREQLIGKRSVKVPSTPPTASSSLLPVLIRRNPLSKVSERELPLAIQPWTPKPK